MIIKSKFKDYYDHIANQYGGGDPRTVYIRNRFKTSDILTINNISTFRELPSYTSRYKFLDGYHTLWLIINGKYYLIIKHYTDSQFKLFTKDRHPVIYHELILNKRFSVRETHNYEYYVDPISEQNELVQVSKIINTPVFTCYCKKDFTSKDKKYIIMISPDIPCLKDIGIPAIISPEQMYQEIEYFIVNRIRESPDTQPPVQVSNKNKITQYGFDLQSSFRHPIK